MYHFTVSQSPLFAIFQQHKCYCLLLNFIPKETLKILSRNALLFEVWMEWLDPDTVGFRLHLLKLVVVENFCINDFINIYTGMVHVVS